MECFTYEEKSQNVLFKGSGSYSIATTPNGVTRLIINGTLAFATGLQIGETSVTLTPIE
ncbi:hypothetical protein D3C71_2057660 [compost metagenome]